MTPELDHLERHKVRGWGDSIVGTCSVNVEAESRALESMLKKQIKERPAMEPLLSPQSC